MPRSVALCDIGVSPLRFQHAGGARVLHDRAGGEDLARCGEALHARGDVHRLPEIILPLVQRDGDARPLVDADLQQQVLAAALLVQLAHRVAHPERRGDRAVGRRERRHHSVADRLHHRARLRRDDLVQHAEMRPHQIEGDEVPDPLVERGRAAQVGEEEGQAGDLQPLVDVERVGAVDVAERLVGEKPLGGEERPPLLHHVVQIVVGDEDGRQELSLGAVLDGKPQRPRPHLQRRDAEHGRSRR